MKLRILFINLLALTSLCSYKVMVKKMQPVTWQYTQAPIVAGQPKELLIAAKLDSNWHIFAHDAGGDGMAIPTEVTANFFNKKNKLVKTIICSDKDTDNKPLSVEMPGFGVVNYFEKNVQYKIIIPSTSTSVKIKVNYQSCNHEMCLPPKEERYTLQLK